MTPYLLKLRDIKNGNKQSEPCETKKPIAKMGAKMKDNMKAYRKIVKEMLEQDDRCQLNTPVCSLKAQGLHHQKRRGSNLLNRKYLLRACNLCNTFLENNVKYSLENGLSILVHKK